ncbi:MAG: hypothetical protein R3E88_12010 [Myxococcota bacterium]
MLALLAAFAPLAASRADEAIPLPAARASAPDADAIARADAAFVRDALARLLSELGVEGGAPRAEADDEAAAASGAAAPRERPAFHLSVSDARELCLAMCERFRRGGIVTSACAPSCARAVVPARDDGAPPRTGPAPQAVPAADARRPRAPDAARGAR